MKTPAQRESQRYLDDPETKEVDDRRGTGIAGAVERLYHDHPVRVEHVAQGDNTQETPAVADHSRIVGKNAHQPRREQLEYQGKGPQIDHVEEPCTPDRFLRPVRLFGAQILTYQRSPGCAQSP